jgi:UDP-glucose 4-epimerase
VRDPITTNDVNVVGTLNLLTAARDAKVRRLVYAGSSSVYGRTVGLPKRETMEASPVSPYAVSKLAGEQYCRSFTELYGFETVILRYFNVFGPRQNPKSEYAAVVPKFIHLVLSHLRPTINGDGSQTRDFTYVENVVQANLLACARDGVAGRVFNIAAGQQVALIDMLRTVERITGIHVEPEFSPRRVGDVEHSLAAIDEAQRVLGFEPHVGLEEGLRRTVQAVRDELVGAAMVG